MSLSVWVMGKMELQKIIKVCLIFGIVFAILTNVSANRKDGVKERNVTKLLKTRVKQYEDDFNNGRLQKAAQEFTENTIFMIQNKETVIGKEAGLDALKEMKMIYNRIEVNVEKAIMISPHYIYHMETVTGYNKKGKKTPGHYRAVVIWKQLGKKWYRDMIVTNSY